MFGSDYMVGCDWLAEFVSYDTKHMAGPPMISLYDPKAGARELERCAKMGFEGGDNLVLAAGEPAIQLGHL
jgi:hypothetical protein